MKTIKSALTSIGALFLVLLVAGFVIEITPHDPQPDNAIYLARKSEGFYYRPPCIMGGGATKSELLAYAEEHNLELGTIDEFKAKGYHYEICRPDNGLRNISLTRYLLIKIGALPDVPSRWEEDGTWNF